MTRIIAIFVLAILIGVVGGIAASYEKKHGNIPDWTLIPFVILFWATVVLFFWGQWWVLLAISVVFVAVLVLAILKCLKKF